MLRSAIPRTACRAAIVRHEIDSLLNLNIEMRYNQTLGTRLHHRRPAGRRAIKRRLHRDRAHHSKRLDVPGEDAEGVIPGWSSSRPTTCIGTRWPRARRHHRRRQLRHRRGPRGAATARRDQRHRSLPARRATRCRPTPKRSKPAWWKASNPDELVAPVKLSLQDGTLTGRSVPANKLGAPRRLRPAEAGADPRARSSTSNWTP